MNWIKEVSRTYISLNEISSRDSQNAVLYAQNRDALHNLLRGQFPAIHEAASSNPLHLEYEDKKNGVLKGIRHYRYKTVLNGMHMVEEIEDVVMATKDVTPKAQSISSKLDSVLSYQEEEVKVQEPSETLLELLELIKLHNVSSEVINKWCSKAGVESIADLGIERQVACIEWINKQYNYAQDMEAA